MNAYISVLKNYATFSGRASRHEFWMFTLINTLISVGIIIVGTVLAFVSPELGVVVTFLSWIYSLAVLLPNLAVSVRRLHDTNKSGWFLLLSFIPLVGGIILIVFFATRGTVGRNDHGADPYGVGDQGVNLM